MNLDRQRARRRLFAIAGALAALALADDAYAQYGQHGQHGQQILHTVTAADGKSQFIITHANAYPAVQIFGPLANLSAPSHVRQALQSGVGGFSTQSGVQFAIEFRWQPSYGYIPIEFKAASAKPAKRDRTLTVRLLTNAWSAAHGNSAEKTFVWPQGAASLDMSMLVPRYVDWNEISWEVFVDGRLDPQLSAAGAQIPNTAVAGNVMVLTTAENAQRRSGYEQALRVSLGDANMAFSAIAASDLPAEWLGYSSVDVMILPLDEFAALLQNQPLRAAALLRWTRAGGNLWIENVGREWDRLAQLEKLLGLPDAADEADDGAATEPALDRGWHWPEVDDQPPSLADGVVELLRTDEPTEPKVSPPPRSRRQPAAVKPPPSKALAVRRFGMGAVVAFQRSLADEAPGRRALRIQNELTHSLIAPRLVWTTRHGNSPDNSNFDFNNFLIPGVGLAPVGQFQFLITLFVIGIGPLNYWLLKRKNKLPLLLVTVPAAALATTALLFAYGVLADGFQTRVRVRSITLLDQQARESATWARLSYYAGIAPRNGLVLPNDAAMYPIVPRWERRLHRSGGVPRELRWRADQQDLTRGWLASRTPTQYLQIAARRSSKRLEVRATDAGLTVANRLGVDVTHLAVQDRQGRVYWGEDLPAGQRKVLQPVERNVAAGAMRRLFSDNLPQFPGDYDATSSGMLYAQSMYEHGLSHNLMEAELAAINSALIDSWGDGSYIAFTKTGVETAVGVEGAEEEASFHVIRGSW